MGQHENKQLWVAIGKNDKALVERAIALGANPNAKGSKTLFGSETALQCAASLADAAAIEVLLKHGARQTPGRHKATPLIALVQAIPHLESRGHDVTDEVLTSLDLLLAKRPNLEAYGGSEYDKGTVICHALRQPVGELVNTVLDRLIEAMQRQKKAFSKDFSQNVLSSAFRSRDVATFKRLVSAGADPKALSDMGSPPPVDLVTGLKGLEKDQWWELFATLGVSLNNPGLGVPEKIVEEANARLLEVRMAHDLSPAHPVAARRPNVPRL